MGKLTSDINTAINNHTYVGAVLIDIEKAFDTVWRDGLLFKLIKLKFPPHLKRLIWISLQDKSFTVCHKRTESHMSFPLREGLQQGEVYSPILYNIFMAAMLSLFSINDETKIPLVRGIAFADDLVLYVTHRNLDLVKEVLQDIFRKILDLYHTWKLKVNINKCETILFRPNTNKVHKKYCVQWRDFKITPAENENSIPHKTNVKYLDVYLDEKLRYMEHVNKQIQKARSAFSGAQSLFHSRKLKSKIKVVCYMVLIRPIISYCGEIWFNIGPSVMEKLRAFERNCLRA